jgi:hypothetical protein
MPWRSLTFDGHLTPLTATPSFEVMRLAIVRSALAVSSWVLPQPARAAARTAAAATLGDLGWRTPVAMAPA